jgi:hypothetical protein
LATASPAWCTFAMPDTPTKKKTSAQREAMVEGRQQAQAVRQYLEALKAANAPRRRGRKRTPESIQSRLQEIQQELSDPELDVIRELKLIQEQDDLHASLADLQMTPPNPEDYEAKFVKVAKAYSERQGISRQAWRALGVPPKVLRDAGV